VALGESSLYSRKPRPSNEGRGSGSTKCLLLRLACGGARNDLRTVRVGRASILRDDRAAFDRPSTAWLACVLVPLNASQ
jgi:hypothetical protein